LFNTIENATLSAWTEPPKIVDQSKTSSPPSTAATSSSTAEGKKPLLSTHFSTTPAAAADISLPASLADLAPSFDSIKNKSKNDLQYTNQMLDASLQHVPDLIDSERPKIYQPRNPYNTPNYYPQQPLVVFDNPVLFDKFDMDTLFYIFYYQQGTYQQ
jgi:CCR4-NOT transcription complex subunit 3